MHGFIKSLGALFAQLGLPDDEPSIHSFVEQHSPLSPEVRLSHAPWWSPAQAAFLREAIELDADWAVAADELDLLLR